MCLDDPPWNDVQRDGPDSNPISDDLPSDANKLVGDVPEPTKVSEDPPVIIEEKD